jgi:chromosome segregation ATPase
MADAYARLMADFSQMTAWGRGLESDLSHARAELLMVKSEVDRLTAFTTRTIIPNEELQAQVERLTQLNDTLALRYDATKSMLDGCAKEIEEMEAEGERLTKENEIYNDVTADAQTERDSLKAEVKRLTKAVMHSPAAQLKLKELEGKTTFEEINPDNQ